ncbi:MAG: hypothetical protein KatS3mg060_0020 [Dehalococcoidia bacterium]|nr:MAG: hypothetical protein KatS3mg060_0020 [Dehalococcoidia bacterium]
MQVRVLLSMAATVVALMVAAAVAWLGSNPVSAANTDISFTCCGYTPANVSINVGDSVTWKPSGADGFGAHPLVSQNGLWPTVTSGTQFVFTFTTPGEYFYYCQFHGGPNGAGMAGKVTVLGSGGPTPTATPSVSPTVTSSPTPTPTIPPGPVGANVSRRLIAILSGASEVPSTTSPATGYALFDVSEDLTQLSFYLSSTVTSTTVAHIHRAPFGENGDPIITLASSPGFTEVRGTAALAPEIASALFTRDLYVNVHSTVFPGGEIRGQIVGMMSFGAQLSGSQEVPPNGSPATGRFQLWLWPDLSRAEFVMTHTVAGANAAHIHRGPPGVNGPVVVPLPAGPNVSGTVPLTPGGLYDLLAGNWYVNVHSPSFPGGEVRGQLGLEHQYQAVLRGSNEVPPSGSANSGVASFILNRTTLQLHYVLSSTIPNTTQAHIHVGPAGANGPVSYTLASTAGFTAVRGTVTLDPRLLPLLETGGLYVNVHSTQNPSGEIRGQIWGPTLFTARLTPQQEVPPAANGFSGRAFLLLNDGQNGFIYALAHDVASPTAAHIHRGAPGVSGPIVYPLQAANQAAASSGVSAADLHDLFFGNLYVNVHNASFPAGAIRGQLVAGTRQLLGIAFKNAGG